MAELRTVALGAAAILAAACAFGQSRVVVNDDRCARPSIYIDKSEGALELRCAGVRRARFEVTFGANPVGPKLREGDERTPEGRYVINVRVSNARFHRFLGVSYPNADDRRRAARAGVTNPGRGIGIHGVNRSRAWLANAWIRVAHDTGLGAVWGPTDGCIALANEDVAWLYERVGVGTPVEIVP